MACELARVQQLNSAKATREAIATKSQALAVSDECAAAVEGRTPEQHAGARRVPTQPRDAARDRHVNPRRASTRGKTDLGLVQAVRGSVARLAAAIEKAARAKPAARSHLERAVRIASADAAELCRNAPVEAVRAVQVEAKTHVVSVRVLANLARAGPRFRSLASRRLIPQLASVALVEHANKALADRFVDLLATWEAEYAESEPDVARAVVHITSTYKRTRSLLRDARVRQTQHANSSGASTAGGDSASVSSTPISDRIAQIHALVADAEDLLQENRQVFNVLGNTGVGELASGRADGAQSLLEDVIVQLNARVTKLKAHESALAAWATSGISAVSGNVDMFTSVADTRQLIADCLERIDAEIQFCAANGVRPPVRTPQRSAAEYFAASGLTADAHGGAGDSDDEDEEWEDAVEALPAPALSVDPLRGTSRGSNSPATAVEDANPTDAAGGPSKQTEPRERPAATEAPGQGTAGGAMGHGNSWAEATRPERAPRTRKTGQTVRDRLNARLSKRTRRKQKRLTLSP